MPATTRLATILLATTLLAGCQHHHGHHDHHEQHAHQALDGTWTTTSHTLNSRGTNHTEKTLTLTVDELGLISGTTGWRLISGEGGHDGEVPTASDTEEVLGSYDAASGVFYLVETEENGFVHGQVLENGELLIFHVQPGTKPVVSRSRMRKMKD